MPSNMQIAAFALFIVFSSATIYRTEFRRNLDNVKSFNNKSFNFQSSAILGLDRSKAQKENVSTSTIPTELEQQSTMLDLLATIFEKYFIYAVPLIISAHIVLISIIWSYIKLSYKRGFLNCILPRRARRLDTSEEELPRIIPPQEAPLREDIPQDIFSREVSSQEVPSQEVLPLDVTPQADSQEEAPKKPQEYRKKKHQNECWIPMQEMSRKISEENLQEEQQETPGMRFQEDSDEKPGDVLENEPREEHEEKARDDFEVEPYMESLLAEASEK